MLHIIINEIRSYYRNGSNLFFTILFPSICVFFLGTFIGALSNQADKPVGELKIGYCICGSDEMSANAFDSFLKALEDKNILTAQKTDAPFTSMPDDCDAFAELNGSRIIIHNGKDGIKNRTVKALIDGYNQSAWAYSEAAQVNPAVLSREMPSDTRFIAHKDLGMNRSMMDYYAVSMTVMIIFFGCCLGGASNYSDEHSNRTISRLYATVSRTKIFFAKIIGSLPMALLQVFTVAFVSTVFYGAHYCDTAKENLLLFAMFISVSLAALALGMFVNLLLPSLPSSMILMPALWVLMFLSGTYAKDIFIEGLSDKLPMYVIQQAAFDLTVFSRGEKAVQVMLVSLAVFMLLIIAGAIKVSGRRKEA